MPLSQQLAAILAIGAFVGLVSTLGIYFDPRAGGKLALVCAGAIRGLLVALLVASTVAASSGWLTATLFGAIYGAVIAVMVVLSHGKEARRHVVYVVPPSVIAGGVIGALVEHLAP